MCRNGVTIALKLMCVELMPSTQIMQDSPTFPLYSEVMNKGIPKAEGGDGSQTDMLQKQVSEGSQPEVPQKQDTEEDIKELDLATAEEIPSVPQQNLTTEDIQKMALSTEVLMLQGSLPWPCHENSIIIIIIML